MFDWERISGQKAEWEAFFLSLKKGYDALSMKDILEWAFPETKTCIL